MNKSFNKTETISCVYELWLIFLHTTYRKLSNSGSLNVLSVFVAKNARMFSNLSNIDI